MKSLKNKKLIKGFTLIELMVSVSIIAILSGVLLQVINPTALRKKTRDKQRVADLKRLQSALELYFADHRQYPDPTGSNSWLNITGSDGLTSTLTNYIEPTVDPTNNDGGSHSGPCSCTTCYRYNYRSNGSNYVLTAIMEVDTSNDEDPCGDEANWGTSCSTFQNQDYCYGVENP